MNLVGTLEDLISINSVTGDEQSILNFIENDYEINIFFEEKNFNLIGWQTLDIYQNLSITFLSNITKNKKLKKNIFKLPKQD